MSECELSRKTKYKKSSDGFQIIEIVEKIRCAKCNLLCIDQMSLDVHIAVIHTRKLECENKKVKNTLLNTEKSIFGKTNKWFYCIRCDSKSNDRNIMRHHMYMKHNIVPLRCIQCGFKANKRNNLNKHIHKKHNNLEKVCNESFEKENQPKEDISEKVQELLEEGEIRKYRIFQNDM